MRDKPRLEGSQGAEREQAKKGSAREAHLRLTKPRSRVDTTSDTVVERHSSGYVQQALDLVKNWASYYQKIDKSKIADSLKEIVLRHILEKAKPVLPEGVEKPLEVIEAYHTQAGENKPSDAKYIEAYKQAFEKWNPEIWQEYKKRDVKFIISNEWDYAKPKYNKEDKTWTFYLPEKTTYAKDTLLRGVDETLTLRHHEIWENNKVFDEDTEIRVKIADRGFEMNMELGDKGWEVTKEYPLALQHKQDYEEGIRKAVSDGSIDTATSANEVRQKGYDYARDMLLKRNQPKGDDPGNYLNALPGSYFEEWDRFTKMQRKVELKEPLKESIQFKQDGPIKLSEDNKTLSMDRPVKLGSDECEILLKFLDTRAKEEGGKSSTLKAALLENGEMWVLPYRFSGKEKTKHSIAAEGNSVKWAGELDWAFKENTDSKGNRVTELKATELKGDSGHYKTYNSDPEKQKAIFQRALSALSDHGVDISGMTDISLMGRRHAIKQSKDEIESQPSGE